MKVIHPVGTRPPLEPHPENAAAKKTPTPPTPRRVSQQRKFPQFQPPGLKRNSKEVERAEIYLATELRISNVPRTFALRNLTHAIESLGPLLDAPRSRWAPPADEWSRLCVALALVVRRLEGWPTTRARARVAIRSAIERAVASDGRSLDRTTQEREEFA